MPELPEVENIRQQLSPLQGALVQCVRQSDYKLRYSLSKQDTARLQGQTLGSDGIHRLGRHIFMRIGTGCLAFHLGMTGSITLAKTQFFKKPHDHVTFDLLDSFGKSISLVYNDPRRFGGVEYLPFTTEAVLKAHWNLGLEPTSLIDAKTIRDLYCKDRPIKPMLMENALVTGIGNIYAAEVCFHARLAPHRLGSHLSADESYALADSIYKTISKAISDGGSTFRNYSHVDGSKGVAQMAHCVYAREGGACPRCAWTVASIVQSGRTTFYCPNCQH